jgi:hypothetical protein
MVYAATKATLLNHLGYQNFGDDIHANNVVGRFLLVTTAALKL